MAEFVDIPIQFTKIFEKAEQYVQSYFRSKVEDPSRAEISIGGERYILVRAEGFCHQFVVTLKELYNDINFEDALDLARGVLYDLAFTMGMADARVYHKATGVHDPIEKLSAGPVHFAFMGWGRVSILPDSTPSPDEEFFLHYDHPNSFESTTWLKSGQQSDCPICFMNAGYSAGWCTVSFGVPLIAVEVECRAAGADHCRFIMTHRNHIRERLKAYLGPQTPDLPEMLPLILRVEDARDQLAVIRRRARIHMLANEGAGESIIIFDEHGSIDFVNSRTLATFGYAENELLSSPPEKIVEGPCLRALRRGDTWSGKLSLRRRDGSTFPAHVTTSPILEQGRDLLGYYLICRDVSELHRADLERIEAERKLREATHDHSLLMAHASRLAAIGEMTAIMTHELNQPLGGIKNYLQGCLWEIEQEDPSKETLTEGLKRTSELVNKASTIIKRLRHFAGQSDDRTVTFSIKDVILEAIGLLKPRFKRMGIATVLTFPESDAPILGDPQRIEQVILNLLVNACDALEGTEVSQRRLEIVVDNNRVSELEITVGDTGAGVAEKHLSKIFDPFFTTKSNGLGLGLPIANTIVKNHNGSITASSGNGEGTVFTITLPIVKEKH